MSRLTDKLTLTFVPLIGSLLIRLLGRCINFKVVDPPKLGEDERAIFAFWHGRMLMIPVARRMLLPGKPFSVMVSRHKDGELISRTVARLDIESSRGSTTRGGAAALKDIIRLARKGYNIVFTPDGPKGPRYAVQMGAIQAALATGLTIHPITYSTRKKKL